MNCVTPFSSRLHHPDLHFQSTSRSVPSSSGRSGISLIFSPAISWVQATTLSLLDYAGSLLTAVSISALPYSGPKQLITSWNTSKPSCQTCHHCSYSIDLLAVAHQGQPASSRKFHLVLLQFLEHDKPFPVRRPTPLLLSRLISSSLDLLLFGSSVISSGHSLTTLIKVGLTQGMPSALFLVSICEIIGVWLRGPGSFLRRDMLTSQQLAECLKLV